MIKHLWLCLLLCACESSSPLPKAALPIPVHTAFPVVEDISIYLEAIGTLHPSLHLEIHPQVEGVLQEIFVKDGAWVSEGTPLFQIDASPYLFKMREAAAQVTVDEAGQRAAMKKWERINQLSDKEIMAKSEWDRYEMEVAKATGMTQVDLARLEMASLDFNRCTIKAPFSGRIGKIEATCGMLVKQSSKPLATLLKIDPLFIEFHLTEKEFEDLKEERIISISPLCKEGFSCSGTITFIDSRFNAESGQIFLRAELMNADMALRPGQIARARIPIEMQKNALLIPQKALKHNQNGPYVLVVHADKTVEERQVRIGKEVKNLIVVQDGLFPKDEVITEGHLRLYPGVQVEIKP